MEFYTSAAEMGVLINCSVFKTHLSILVVYLTICLRTKHLQKNFLLSKCAKTHLQGIQQCRTQTFSGIYSTGTPLTWGGDGTGEDGKGEDRMEGETGRRVKDEGKRGRDGEGGNRRRSREKKEIEGELGGEGIGLKSTKPKKLATSLN
jgi:hypothetical protein